MENHTEAKGEHQGRPTLKTPHFLEPVHDIDKVRYHSTQYCINNPTLRLNGALGG